MAMMPLTMRSLMDEVQLAALVNALHQLDDQEECLKGMLAAIPEETEFVSDEQADMLRQHVKGMDSLMSSIHDMLTLTMSPAQDRARTYVGRGARPVANRS